MAKFLLTGFYFITLLGCSTQLSSMQSPNSVTSEVQNDPNYPLALAFDTLLKNGSDAAAKTTVDSNCKTASRSPLCSPLRKIKALKTLLSQKSAVFKPSGVKPLAPVAPLWKNDKIANWKNLRQASIPNLLKGLLPLSQEQLSKIAKMATEEKRCPNNIAIAVAATLEDYLPDSTLYPKLASLYEKGGLCTKQSPADRENFLTRSGLFYFLTKDFSKAVKVLSKVKPTDAYSGRTAYWLYRSKKAMSDSAGVAQALNRLATQHRFSFHNLMASQQENREPIPEFSKSLTFPERSKKFKQFNNDIQSIEILLKLGFEESAHLIVDWLLTQPKLLEAGLRVYLANLGDPHAKVVQMPGVLMFNPELISKESISINFPQAFFPLFEKHRGRVSPYLLLSIARRESSFNPKAVSPANAQGLLQMNPETVKVLYPSDHFNLLDPETNISIASKYFSKVLDEMGGDLPLTLAGYNAGEEQARSWGKRYPREDKILWIDLVPYRETRDYIANVLSTYYWYRKIYENNSNFSELLSK